MSDELRQVCKCGHSILIHERMLKCEDCDCAGFYSAGVMLANLESANAALRADVDRLTRENERLRALEDFVRLATSVRDLTRDEIAGPPATDEEKQAAVRALNAALDDLASDQGATGS